MLVNSSYNFSDEKIWYFHLQTDRWDTKLTVETDYTTLKITLSNSDFTKLLAHLIDEDYFEVDENGKMKVVEL